MALATPRILPRHLHAFSPSNHPSTTTVRMLGHITAIHGDQATLSSHNNETVTLILNRDSHLQMQSLYEVVGKVINLEGGAGLGIRVLTATHWPKSETGQAIDLKIFEAVVDATHRHRQIFFQDSGDGDGGAGAGGY